MSVRWKGIKDIRDEKPQSTGKGKQNRGRKEDHKGERGGDEGDTKRG